MGRHAMIQDLTPERIRTARLVALGVDLLQIVLLPAFFPAVLSPAADVLDLAAAIVLIRLLGWHWAFLPTFVAELIPVVGLVPTWTAAVLLATRHGASVSAPPPVVTVEPRPGTEPRSLPAGRQDDRRDSSNPRRDSSSPRRDSSSPRRDSPGS